MLTLFVASAAMLVSGVVAAVLGSMRRGPDVLDHATFFSRDSSYVNVSPCYSGSVEDASEQLGGLETCGCALEMLVQRRRRAIWPLVL
ncbi:hypothetical protein CKAH01_11776 [Colletotrichum kahawae]|uniref:Secreted protein n=1 Tax=Colletotrichum kahawae TaxID=34407 RepID=A0AAD9YSP1_COLKA|nr:hypothetical protein CKAH01_11776 [Colletotrichum kahawae]